MFNVFMIDARGSFRMTFRPLSRGLAEGYAAWCRDGLPAERARVVVVPA